MTCKIKTFKSKHFSSEPSIEDLINNYISDAFNEKHLTLKSLNVLSYENNSDIAYPYENIRVLFLFE